MGVEVNHRADWWDIRNNLLQTLLDENTEGPGDGSISINPARRDPFQSRDPKKRSDYEVFERGDAVSIKETADRNCRFGWIMGRAEEIQHPGTAFDDTEARRYLVELTNGTLGTFDAKSMKHYNTKERPSWERQAPEPQQKEIIQREIREPPAEVIPEQQTVREELIPRQPRQPMTEIREMEEVEVDQIPDVHPEPEEPAHRTTAPARQPAKPAAKPRGTALMDGGGWCGMNTENIVSGGTRTRRCTGHAMVAEEESDSGRAMDFVNNLKNFVKEAVLDALGTGKPRPGDADDEKEDNLGSISAPARDEQQSPDANQQPTRKILGYNQKDQEVDSELEKPLA